MNDGFDLAANQVAVVVDFDNLIPVLLVGCFLIGEDNHALFVFESLEKDFDLLKNFSRLIGNLIVPI